MKGNLNLTKAHLDSVDTSVFTILQVSFSGTIAIVQVVNLILKLQEDRRRSAFEEKIPISIAIEAGNGKKIEFKVSGEITDEEISNCLKSVQEFRSNLLKAQDARLFETSLDGKKSLNIEAINSLFKRLFAKNSIPERTAFNSCSR